VRAVTIVANDVGPNGGMELALLELIKGLVAAGDRVTVIARTCDVQGDIVSHRVPGPSRPFVVAYPWFFLAAGVLVRLHRDGVVQATGAIVPNRVDIVSVHFCHRGFAAKGGVTRSSRQGLLFRVHAKLAAAMSRAGESLCFRPSRLSRVVAVSRGVAEEVGRHYPAIANAVVVIPNGVDIERFSPSPDGRAVTRSKLGFANYALVALFVGGDWERKGLALAIEALAQAPQWTLLIAGTGDQWHYAESAERSGVSERTYFLGQVADTVPLFRAADVLVLPTPVNGIVDLIRDGVSGYFIERDAESIAYRLRSLGSNPSALAHMSVEARLATRTRSWRSVVEQHRALYAAIGDEPR
jgi:glycosyltransferase involved in cell wall biosynthesis